MQRDECRLKLEYLYALIAFNDGNYDLSISKCDWIITNYNMEFDWLKGFVYLLRAKNYDLLQKRKLALKDYKNVIKMDQYYPEVSEAKDYIKNPFSL